MAVGCHTYIWAELSSLFKKEHWSGNVDLADTDRSARGGTDTLAGWLAGRTRARQDTRQGVLCLVGTELVFGPERKLGVSGPEYQSL